jgi:hypothetical protein
MTTAVPAAVYTAALFSDAHVLSLSHKDDDDGAEGDADGDAALIEVESPDMVQKEQQQIKRTEKKDWKQQP